MLFPVIQHLRRELRGRKKLSLALGQGEAGRHHSYDRGLGVVHENAAADRVRVSTVARLPQAVAQNDHVYARSIVIGGKRAAKDRLNTEDVEQVDGDGASQNRFRQAVAGEAAGAIATTG